MFNCGRPVYSFQNWEKCISSKYIYITIVCIAIFQNKKVLDTQKVENYEQHFQHLTQPSYDMNYHYPYVILLYLAILFFRTADGLKFIFLISDFGSL